MAVGLAGLSGEAALVLFYRGVPVIQQTTGGAGRPWLGVLAVRSLSTVVRLQGSPGTFAGLDARFNALIESWKLA